MKLGCKSYCMAGSLGTRQIWGRLSASRVLRKSGDASPLCKMLTIFCICVSWKEGSNCALNVCSTHRAVSQGRSAENTGAEMTTRKEHNPDLSIHANLAGPLLFQPCILWLQIILWGARSWALWGPSVGILVVAWGRELSQFCRNGGKLLLLLAAAACTWDCCWWTFRCWCCWCWGCCCCRWRSWSPGWETHCAPHFLLHLHSFFS